MLQVCQLNITHVREHNNLKKKRKINSQNNYYNLYVKELTSESFISTEDIEEIPTANCVRKWAGKGKFLFFNVKYHIIHLYSAILLRDNIKSSM